MEDWHFTLRDAQATIARDLGYESWTDLLRQVEGTPRWDAVETNDFVKRAYAEAKEVRHGFITDHHFLLALLNPPEPTPSSEVLTELGVSRAIEQEKVAKWDRRRRKDGAGSTPMFQLTLGWAQGIAIGMGASQVTDEHLLLAMVYGDRGGESLLVWLDVDPDDVVSGLQARGIQMPPLRPPVPRTPIGPFGPWVYFPEADSRAVVQELVKTHPPGTAYWGTNSSKWKKGYLYVHGEDEIPMEEIVRRAVKAKKQVEVLPFKEGMVLEHASAPRRYRDRPQKEKTP